MPKSIDQLLVIRIRVLSHNSPSMVKDFITRKIAKNEKVVTEIDSFFLSGSTEKLSI